MKGSQGAVAGLFNFDYSYVTVAAGNWISIASIAIPNEEMENYSIYIMVKRKTTGTILNAYVRAKVNLDGVDTYFPSSSSFVCPVVYDDAPVGKNGLAQVLLIIPRNLQGKTVYIEIYSIYADDYLCYIKSFGDSPHYHR